MANVVRTMPVRGEASSGRTSDRVRPPELIVVWKAVMKTACRQYISGLKIGLEQGKEARIHDIDYRTLGRAFPKT